MELPEFLRARLDEQADIARLAANGDSGGWFVGEKWNVYRVEDENPWDDEEHQLVVYGNMSFQSDHIAANDPAYVLADVTAKRRIVDWAMALLETLPNDPGAVLMFEQAGSALLHLLAAPHAGHPDFDPAWKVD